MATMRDIKRRIGTVKNIQQITKAMKIVSATKLRKAQEAILNARPYALSLEKLISHLAARVDRERHPLLKLPARREKIGVMIITGDRGLCGSFNSNILRQATRFINAELKGRETELLLIGRKGYEFFKRRDYKVKDYYADFFEELSYGHAMEAGQKLQDFYLNGSFDEVYLVYNWFKSVLTQEVLIQKVLPIEPDEQDPIAAKGGLDYIYEPDADAVLDRVVPQYIAVEVWRCLLESTSAEHAARMTAMENASRNAGEMIGKLTLYFNRARQAAITTELSEIVGGAEALKG